jgi:hypothetical protein
MSFNLLKEQLVKAYRQELKISELKQEPHKA